MRAICVLVAKNQKIGVFDAFRIYFRQNGTFFDTRTLQPMTARW